MWAVTSASLALLAIMTFLAVLFLLERNKAQDSLAGQNSLTARNTLQEEKYGESILYYDAARNLGRNLSGDPGFATAWEECRNLKDQFRSSRAAAYARFSDNSQMLAVQDNLGAVHVRDLAQPETIWISKPSMIQSMSSAIGHNVVAGREEGNRLVVRRLSDWEIIYEKAVPEQWKDIRDLTLSQNGDFLFYRKLPNPPNDLDSFATIVETATGREQKIEEVKSLNFAKWWFAPDGTNLYHFETEGFYGMSSRVWDTATGRLLAESSISRPVTHQLVESNFLVVAFDNGFTGCLEVDTLKLLWSTPPDRPMPVLQMAAANGAVKIWDATLKLRELDLQTGQINSEIGGDIEVALCAEINENTQLIADRSGTFRISQNQEPVSTETWLSDQIVNLALSPDGRLAYSGALNGVNRIWNILEKQAGPSLRNLRPDGSAFSNIQSTGTNDAGDFFFETDKGRYQLQPDGSITAYGEYVTLHPLPETIPSATVTASLQNGQITAEIDQLGKVTIRDARNTVLRSWSHPTARSAGQEILMQNAAQPDGGAALSPEGRYLATSHGFYIYLWEWKLGTLAWKSRKIPAGLFGRLSVAGFPSADQILITEGNNVEGNGFPNAWLISIPNDTPDTAELSLFAREVLQMKWEKGVLRPISQE